MGFAPENQVRTGLTAGGASQERTRLGNKSIPEAFWRVISQFWHEKPHKSQPWLRFGRTEDGV